MVDWAWHVKFSLISKSYLFASLLCLWNICETCKNGWKQSLLHILNGCAHICLPTGSCYGPWNSPVVSLVWAYLPSQSSTWYWAMDFECFCRLSTNYTYLTCWNWVCQHSVMAEATVKQHAFAIIISISNIWIPGFVYVSAIFSAVNIRHNVTHHVPGFCQTVVAWWRSWHCGVQTVSLAPFESCNGV